MRIETSGNVGIGTTSTSGTKLNTSVSTVSNAITATLATGAHDCSAYIATSASGVYNFDFFGGYNSSGIKFRVDGAGNVFTFGGTISSGAITASGIIHSTSGGIQFPDSSVQTTAGSVSPATNGYQVLPSGLILQWGQATVNANSSATIGFNTTFPNACYNIQLTQTLDFNYTGGPFALGVDTTTNTSNFTVWNNNSGLYGFFWFAIGI
jgi:hypothetical protein